MATRHEIMTRLTERTEQVCVELAINAHAELVEATPVDTGWARANWIPSLGSPAVVVVGAADAVDKAPQEAGLAAVLAFKLTDKAIFVSNHVPYISRLDAGSSDQAPAGFVRTAMAKAVVAQGNGRITPL